MTNWNRQLAEMKKEFGWLCITAREDSWFIKFLYYALLMFLWNKQFLTNYTTVIPLGIVTFIQIPKNMIGTDKGYRILRHEHVHIKDSKCWLVIPFALTYTLVLPAGLTLRSVWEKRGYKETMRVWYELYGVIPDHLLDNIKQQFVSSYYLWMWPFPKSMDRWLVEARQDVIQEYADKSNFA